MKGSAMRVKMICQECGKMYIEPQGRVEKSKYCSRKCANYAIAKNQAKAYIQQVCSVCGKEFTTAKRHAKTTCSKECAHKARLVGFKKYREANPKKAVVPCAYCGKPVETWSCRLRTQKHHFCNKECYDNFQYQPEYHVIMTCEICGEEYETTTAQVKHRGSRFCSPDCLNVANARRMAGERNPNWKGGITDGPYVYTGFEPYRKQAIERDGYTCQVCGITINEVPLHVHHIIPARRFAPDYQEAHVLSNLITLCPSCHNKVGFGILPCPYPNESRIVQLALPWSLPKPQKTSTVP